MRAHHIVVDIAQALTRASCADMEGRIVRRWRFKPIVFYGSLLAELIFFAVLSQHSPIPPSSSFDGGEPILGNVLNVSETGGSSRGAPSHE